MTDITDEDRRAAASILWVQTVIDDQAGIERAFAAHRLAAEARGAERERARVVDLRTALKASHVAMAEFYRYWTGGETRGSYDGRPERDGLWKAMYAARAALSRHADQGEGL